MTIEIFLILLTVCAMLTGLITEAIKQTFVTVNKPYSANVLALVVAVIVGALVMIIYYTFNGLPWNTVNTICVGLMMLFNWLGATLGYDKVIQTITQIKLKGSGTDG